MTAPETIDPEGFTNMGCGCGRLYSYGGHVEPGQHDPDCPASRSLALARLQARWDARDEVLRGLIEKWRERTVTVMPSALTAADTERLTWAAAADELERAMEVGKC